MRDASVSTSKSHFQKSDLVKIVTDQVLKDINYIKNFKSAAPEAKLKSHYKDAQIIKRISSATYPQVFAYIVRKYDPPEAIQRLREMGRRSVAIFYSTYPRILNRPTNFSHIFQEIGKNSAEKIQITEKVKKKKVIQSCQIKKHNCIFCTESFPIESIGIAYCYPSLSFFQHYYNIRSLYLGNMKPRLIYLEVVKTAEDDNDTCIYSVEAID